MSMTATQAQQLYVAYFNRPADTLGLAYWTGKPAASASAAFAASAEYTATYAGMSTAQIVNAIYTNLFGRGAEPAGISYWGGLIENGKISISNAVTQIAGGAQGSDLVAYNNKVKAAEAFTTALDTTAEIVAYSGTAANTAAKAFLSGITTDATFTAATTTAALNASVASVVTIGSIVPGQSVALTDKVDILTGTAGNDTFTADIATLGAGDSIVGGLGTDTLNFTGTTNVAVPAATITGVEVFNIRQTTAAMLSTDLSVFSGLSTLNYDRSNQVGIFTNLGAGGTYGIVGNGSVINANTLALGYASGSKVTDATINFSGGTLGAQAVTLTGANLLTTTINSTGAANVTGAFVDAATSKTLAINATTGLTTGTIGDSTARTGITINATGDVVTGAVTSSAATTVAISGAGKVTTDLNAVVAPTITVAGSGAVTLGTLNAASTTVTSTQTAGSLTATMNAVATSKLTGGAGNDVITTGAVLTTGAVDGGAGNDTLIIGANVAHINTASLAGKYTNFETLRLQGTLDMALLPSITAVELTAGASVITNMTVTQAAAVMALGDLTTTTLTLATATGTSDVVNLKLGTGLTTDAAANSGVLTLTGFETLNLSTNAGPTATAVANRTSTVTGAIVDTSLTAVNLTGTAFVFTDIASTKAVTWNGSALIGDGNTTAASVKGLTVAGNAAAGSTITGSNFVDSFTIGAAGSTYNAGAGNDLVISTQAVLAGSVAVDGGAGTKDVVRLTDTATTTNTLTIADNAFRVVSGFETVNFSGAVAGSFNFVLGGYANAVAAANGGVITATATAFASAVTADVHVIDASGLSGTNAINLTLTNTSLSAATNTGTTTITGSAGADTIVFTEAGTAGANLQRVVNISGGAGNDTITVASTSVGVALIDGGSGNDTITGSAQIDSITGGTGADTMTGGAGVDTFIFSTNGSVIGTSLDVITDMAAADILQFSGTLVLLGADNSALVAGSNVQQSTGGKVTFATADNTLALKIAAIQADTQLDAALSVAFFEDSGNTFAYYSGTATGNTDDQLVQLTGVAGLTTITVAGGGVNNMVIA